MAARARHVAQTGIVFAFVALHELMTRPPETRAYTATPR